MNVRSPNSIRPIDCLLAVEIAKLAGCSRANVALAIQKKKLPSIRVGRRRYVRDDDAAAWIASRRSK